ncbi:MAG: hypothetical protein ABSF08_06810 [Candidatus Cybelea sp.]|jgi:hypothetical protein
MKKTLKAALCSAVALLAGCVETPSLAPSILQTAWMDGSAAKADLAYVADGNGEVVVFNLSNDSLAGVLTRFNDPKGDCVDKKGDVFVADFGALKVDEYAHGGKKPIAVIDTSPYQPYACSVDLKSGNLAVANYGTTTKGAGNIAVYAHATGQPVLYTDSSIANFEACGYDGQGDLLVSNGAAGEDGYSSFALLANGGTQLTNVTLPGPSSGFAWREVDGIQWDGRYWTVDESGATYRISISHGIAYYVGHTYLDSGGGGPAWLYGGTAKKQATQALEADGEGDSAVYVWNYPAGGEPIAYLNQGLDEPFGVTVSPAAK